MENHESLTQLMDNVLEVGRENEWVEFKTNLIDAEIIGTYISALANSSTLSEVPYGFLIWGVSDDDHAIIGTYFDPHTAKVGNQALIPWLHSKLDPEVLLQFQSLKYRGQRIVILRIGAARSNPVKFQKTAYIRIDSHKVELARHPAYEQRLWSILLREPADQSIAQSNLPDEQVLQVLDIDAYYRQYSLTRPSNTSTILDRLLQHRFVRQQQNGKWEIRTQAALLFGRNLDDFDQLGQKSIRIVQYQHDSRIETVREIRDTRGYAISFDDSVQYIMNLLPSREVIHGARRINEPMLPSLAIREIIANALVHQDLSIRGSSPIIEIFPSRIECTNPGHPLVDIKRLIDAPPNSRNEALAAAMREMGFCEERGSGWDKIAYEVSAHFLPAPVIEITDHSTRIVLFGPQPFSRLSREDRVWATYIHACLLYCQREHLTNSRVRERFGIAPKNSATASRIISDTVESGWLIPFDPDASKRLMQYVPYWAGTLTT